MKSIISIRLHLIEWSTRNRWLVRWNEKYGKSPPYAANPRLDLNAKASWNISFFGKFFMAAGAARLSPSSTSFQPSSCCRISEFPFALEHKPQHWACHLCFSVLCSKWISITLYHRTAQYILSSAVISRYVGKISWNPWNAKQTHASTSELTQANVIIVWQSRRIDFCFPWKPTIQHFLIMCRAAACKHWHDTTNK